MEDSDSNEKQLINDILNGQREQYRHLVDRYAPMVFHIVRKYVDEEAEVEEQAQQIFVKCYERLDSFRKESKFSSWLYMLAKNHCLDYVKNVRRNNKRMSEMEDAALEMEMKDEETPETRLVRMEWQQSVHKALEKITPDNAQAFLLKYRDGMTYKAMSGRLGVSVSALKVRVHRARKELIDHLETNSGL